MDSGAVSVYDVNITHGQGRVSIKREWHNVEVC